MEGRQLARFVLGAKLVHQFYPPHTLPNSGGREQQDSGHPATPASTPNPGWLSPRPRSHAGACRPRTFFFCRLARFLAVRSSSCCFSSACRSCGARPAEQSKGLRGRPRRAGAWQAVEAQRAPLPVERTGSRPGASPAGALLWCSTRRLHRLSQVSIPHPQPPASVPRLFGLAWPPLTTPTTTNPNALAHPPSSPTSQPHLPAPRPPPLPLSHPIPSRRPHLSGPACILLLSLV